MNSKKPVVLYGIICGIALTVYVRILDISKVIYNTSWGAWLGYLAILILPACIFLAFRELKKRRAAFTYRHALMAGLLVSIITATVYSAYIFVDIHFFNARHLNNLFDYTVSSMQKAGYKAAEIQIKIGRMKNHYFSARPYISTFVSYLVLGIFFSSVFFLFFRKTNPTKYDH